MTHFNITGSSENDDDLQVNFSFQSDNIHDIVANMQLFLRGLGYDFDELIVTTKSPMEQKPYDSYGLKPLDLKPITTADIQNLVIKPVQSLTTADLSAWHDFEFK